MLTDSRSKRDGVDWSKVSYDLSGVNWDQVFSKTPAAAAAPTPAAQKQEAPAAQPAAASPTPAEAKKASAPSSAAAQSSKAAEPSKSPSLGDIVDEAVGDLMAGVAAVGAAIDAKVGINSKTSNGGLWVGKDGDWGMDVTNNGPDAVYYCWIKNGFSGMTVNVNAPAISVGIKSGKTVSISAAPGVSGACAPATTSTGKSSFGGIKNTWAEFTMGDPSTSPKKMGVFNVSKNVYMKGCDLSMQGSTCTSDKSRCIFECKDKSQDSCETGYELLNCSASNGGGGGYDPIMQGVGGGCNMPDNGERIKVSFS